jgi:hypothetical protein
MGVAVGARIGGALLCILPCAAALTEEPELVLGGDDLRNAPVARKVTLGNNLFVNGYAVIGPDNCLSPGTTQWIGVPFIAAGTNVRMQISAPLIVRDRGIVRRVR